MITVTVLILKNTKQGRYCLSPALLQCDVELSVPSPVEDIKTVSSVSKVEPRHNEGPMDWQNYFVRLNEVSLYRGSFSFISLSLG